MADNNLARSRNDLPDFFADDDPLAELARIVGYEDRPIAKPAAPAPVARHEPAFNLEDELLREFERYDAPRLDPVHDIAFGEAPEPVAPTQMAPPALAFDASDDFRFVDRTHEPERDPLPVFPQPEAVFEPVDDFGFGDGGLSPANDHQSAAPVFHAEPASDRTAPIFDLPELPLAGPVSSVAAEQSVEEFDLAAELESSFADEEAVHSPVSLAPVPPVAEPVHAPVVEPEPQIAALDPASLEPKAKGYVPGFRMPLANFNAAAAVAAAPISPASALAAAPLPEVPASVMRNAEPSVDPKFDIPVLDEVQPSKTSLPAHEEWIFGQPAASKAAVPAFDAPARDVPALETPAFDVNAAEPVRHEPTIAVPPAAEVSKDRYSALDELIYDVQRYSLPTSAPRSLATPVAKAPEPAQPVAAPIPQVDPVVAAAPAIEEKDPFADDEFELALDDLELDLADLVMEDTTKPAPVMAPVAASAPVAMPEPVIARAAPVAPAVVDMPEEAELAFDPAQIADSEEHVEAIADLEVPDLPVEEPEEPPIYRPDYELDIDAELASLLTNANTKAEAAPSLSRGHASSAAAAKAAPEQRVVQPTHAPAYADLDDFERALEEDFRKSLTAPLPRADQEELQYPESDYVATVETARRSVRSWAVPLVLAGVVIFGGAGAYAWLSGKRVPGVSGGEPVIIAADASPVKVAPANPGGKTVPNQDKAVYDRVAGGPAQDPKQRQLISTNEQPVDVVQKTLMPDTLPLEGENDIDPTDVGETQDPRLLPNGGQVASLPAEQQPVTVMPRKVKTMIVRPDGKLVEQEVPAPALAAVDQAKVPAAGAKPIEVAAAAPTGARPQPAAVIPASAPVNAAANGAKPATQTAQPFPSAPAQAAAQPSARGPVPAARPAEQPVNVVAAVTEQGAVRAPSQPAAAPAAPTQVASLGGDGGYVIQIASLPSQADAQKSYQNLSSKFGNVIGGRGVDIKAAEIAGKGTFYRVRIPAGSKDNAVALCEKYRAAGGSCLVVK